MYKNYKKINYKNFNKFLTFLFYKYQRVFFASLIWKGKKLITYNIMLNIKQKIKLIENNEFHIVFLFSLLNITPNILLSYLKIGGNKQGVPLAISWKKKITFAIKWIKKAIIDKFKKIKLNSLINEIINLNYNKGLSIQFKKKAYIEGLSNKFLLKKFKYKYKN